MLRNVRGSPPYFEKCKKDLFAMIRQLGNPTWFCSFSAAETRWHHLLKILGRLVDKKEYTVTEINEMNWQKKSELIQKDPVTCARNLDHMVQRLICDVLKSSVMPIGEIADYFYRVEFQQRGSPHIHALFWIENAPQYEVNTNMYVLTLSISILHVKIMFLLKCLNWLIFKLTDMQKHVREKDRRFVDSIFHYHPCQAL